MLDFREVRMCQFTTPTTCYSSVKRKQRMNGANENSARKGQLGLKLRLATENHIIQVNCDVLSSPSPKLTGESQPQKNDWQITSETFTRDTNTIVCVGYSQHGEYPDDIEALALLDPSLVPLHQRQAIEPPAITMYHPSQMNQQQQNQDDAASVISTSQRMSSSDMSLVSSNQSQAASNAPGANSRHSSAGSGLGDTNINSATSTTSGGGGDSIDKTSTSQDPPKKRPMARLMLRTPTEHVAFVDFTPVCPCVAQLSKAIEYYDSHPEDSNTVPTKQFSVGVWVGSSNDTQLRLFIPDLSGSGRQLIQHNLESYPEFSFTTPILAIDYYFYNDDDGHTNSKDDGTKDGVYSTLAVACQDGSICLISWQGGLKFENIQSSTFIVDGPIVTLQLSPLVRRGDSASNTVGRPRLQLLVGSLCGYVCRLVEQQEIVLDELATSLSTETNILERTIGDKTDGDDFEVANQKKYRWDGPFMVVQGFWNHSIDLEDSVMVVHHVDHHDMVVVGTLAGRCLLYKEVVQHSRSPYSQAIKGEYRYFKIWECVLPYPIHGIVSLYHSDEGQQLSQQSFDLLITTRRSIHLFQASQKVDENNAATLPSNDEVTAKIKNSAASAKDRLLAILKRQKDAIASTKRQQEPSPPEPRLGEESSAKIIDGHFIDESQAVESTGDETSDGIGDDNVIDTSAALELVTQASVAEVAVDMKPEDTEEKEIPSQSQQEDDEEASEKQISDNAKLTEERAEENEKEEDEADDWVIVDNDEDANTTTDATRPEKEGDQKNEVEEPTVQGELEANANDDLQLQQHHHHHQQQHEEESPDDGNVADESLVLSDDDDDFLDS